MDYYYITKPLERDELCEILDLSGYDYEPRKVMTKELPLYAFKEKSKYLIYSESEINFHNVQKLITVTRVYLECQKGLIKNSPKHITIESEQLRHAPLDTPNEPYNNGKQLEIESSPHRYNVGTLIQLTGGRILEVLLQSGHNTRGLPVYLVCDPLDPLKSIWINESHIGRGEVDIKK